ncbi:unnamed protein product [Rotaria sp. Silwood1]|nr:unnamed protein product [Rotaria sp. Silwood1]
MALSFLASALDIYNCILFTPHHQIAQCLGYLGLVYEDKNELGMALDYFNQQLEMEEQCLPLGHWRFAEHIGWIVHVHMKMDNRNEAEKLCQKESRHAKRTLGAAHPHAARMQMLMAELAEDNEPDQALRLYKKAVSILNVSTKPDDRSLVRCFLAMANLNNKRNNFRDALKYDKKAVLLASKCMPRDHVDMAFSLKNLGISYYAINNVQEARSCFSKSLSIYRNNYTSEHIAMKLYTLIVTNLVEQTSETNSNELQQPYVSINSDHKNELTIFQQSSQFYPSISTLSSTSESVNSTTAICAIL